MSAVACMYYYMTCSLLLLHCSTYLALWRLFPTSRWQLNKDSLIHFLLLQGMFWLLRKIGKSCDQSSKKLYIKKKTTLNNLPSILENIHSTLNKNLHSKSTYFLKLTHQESWRSNGFLKGQSQLIHMLIWYHFLAICMSRDTRVKHTWRYSKQTL